MGNYFSGVFVSLVCNVGPELVARRVLVGRIWRRYHLEQVVRVADSFGVVISFCTGQTREQFYLCD